MALLWFGGLDRYQVGTIAKGAWMTTAFNSVIPAQIANLPLPNTNTIRIRANGQTIGFNICQLPGYLNNSEVRKWLELRTVSAGSSARANRYFEIGFFSADIPDHMKQLGSVICFGCRYRQGVIPDAQSRRYIGFGYYNETTIKATPTYATADAATKYLPLERLATHPLMNENEEKFVEYRIKYMPDDVCLIKVFVNKDLVLTERCSYSAHWGIFLGAPRGAIAINASVPQSLYYNDFYMGYDAPGEEKPTDLIGPVTCKPLELLPPVTEGEWKSSVPESSDMTLQDVLSQPLPDKRRILTGNYVVTDSGDRPAHFSFKAPLDETLKIVAFQHDLIAQQPIAYSTSLQYQRTFNGISLEPNGKPQTINVALEPNFSHIGLSAITHTHEGEDLTAEYIGGLGITINSTKKFVPDDVIEEEETVATEEGAD